MITLAVILVCFTIALAADRAGTRVSSRAHNAFLLGLDARTGMLAVGDQVLVTGMREGSVLEVKAGDESSIQRVRVSFRASGFPSDWYAPSQLSRVDAPRASGSSDDRVHDPVNGGRRDFLLTAGLIGWRREQA